jgi:hypothetical protein
VLMGFSVSLTIRLLHQPYFEIISLIGMFPSVLRDSPAGPPQN